MVEQSSFFSWLLSVYFCSFVNYLELARVQQLFSIAIQFVFSLSILITLCFSDYCINNALYFHCF